MFSVFDTFANFILSYGFDVWGCHSSHDEENGSFTILLNIVRRKERKM